MMEKYQQQRILLPLIILTLIVASHFAIKNLEKEDISPYYLFPIILFVLGTLTINATRLQILLNVFQIQISAREALSLAILTNITNYLSPFKGGATAKAIYMKKHHEFPFTSFLSLLVAGQLIILFVYGCIGVLATIAVTPQFFTSSHPLLILFGSVAIGVAVFMIVALKIPTNDTIPPIIKCGLDGIQTIFSNKKILLFLLPLEALSAFMVVARLWLAFHALGYPVTILVCLLFALVSSVSTAISLMPAGIGVREATVGITAKALGYDLNIAVLASLLDRAIALSIALIFLPFSEYELLTNLLNDKSPRLSDSQS